MDIQRIPHVYPPVLRPARPDPQVLVLECAYQAVRHNLWCAQFVAQTVHLDHVRDRITPLLAEVDRLRAELDLL